MKVFVRLLSFQMPRLKDIVMLTLLWAETMLRLPGFFNVVRRTLCNAAEDMGKKGAFFYAVRKGFKPGVYQTWWTGSYMTVFCTCVRLLHCMTTHYFSPKGRNVNIRWISFPMQVIRSLPLKRMLGPLWGANLQHHLLGDQLVISKMLYTPYKDLP